MADSRVDGDPFFPVAHGWVDRGDGRCRKDVLVITASLHITQRKACRSVPVGSGSPVGAMPKTTGRNAVRLRDSGPVVAWGRHDVRRIDRQRADTTGR